MATLFRPAITNPSAIEEESFRIIDSELSPHFRFSPVEHAVIRRVIHATADFEYARNMRIHEGAIAAFQAAMAAKADIICDVQMVMAGVSAPGLAMFGAALSARFPILTWPRRPRPPATPGPWRRCEKWPAVATAAWW